MAAFTDATWAALRSKLGYPDDATPAQVNNGVNVLIAQAKAVETGTVSNDPVRARLNLSDTDPESLVLAAADSLQLQAAKNLGLSAGSTPGEVKAASAAARHAVSVYAAQAAAKSAEAVSLAPPAASTKADPPKRIAAASYADPRGIYASNPLVDAPDVRSVYASAAEAAGGRVPGLFAAGDVPVFTASGIDPGLLKSVPWMARHTLASEPDRAKALQMFEELSSPGGDVLASSPEYVGHANNRAYEQRVMEWASAGWAAQQAANEEQRRVAASAQAEAVAEAVGPPEEWTDEQSYEHMFGVIDRSRAERKAGEERAFIEGRTMLTGRRMPPRKAQK